MKKFLLGFLCGVCITIGVIYATSYGSINNASQKIIGLTKIENGETIPSKQVRIFQVLEPNAALAHLTNHPEQIYDSEEILVLFIGEENSQFYDAQKINIPTGKFVKRIGTYVYKSQKGIERTVPAVEIQ